MLTATEERKRVLNEELKRVLELIIKEYAPEKIILFGSLVTNNIHEWSDIDLTIIKDTDKRFLDRLHEVHLMAKPKVGVNFIVYTSDELKRMIDENRYFLINEILKKGKVLYEKQ